MSDGEGFLWVLAIGASIWAWSNHEKLGEEREARAVAHQRMQLQVDDLSSRINEMQRKIDFAESDIESVSKAHESLRKTFNGNVDIDNRAKVARLTAAGACGTETVRFDNGGWAVRNKECTLKDLR